MGYNSDCIPFPLRVLNHRIVKDGNAISGELAPLFCTFSSVRDCNFYTDLSLAIHARKSKVI